MSMPSGSSAVSAAPISEPSSIVPVVSKARETSKGRSAPSASRARRAPRMDDFVWRRSWVVSTIRASAPPAIRPSAFAWKPSRSVWKPMWPRVGSFVPGPMEPQHPPPAAVAAGELVGHLAGDAGARLGQLVHAVGDLVLGHGRVVGAEGVHLHAVHARLRK